MALVKYRAGVETLKPIGSSTSASEALGMWWAHKMLFSSVTEANTEDPALLAEIRAERFSVDAVTPEIERALDTVGGFAMAITDLAEDELAKLAEKALISPRVTLSSSNEPGNASILLRVAAARSDFDLNQVPAYPIGHITTSSQNIVHATASYDQAVQQVWSARQ